MTQADPDYIRSNLGPAANDNHPRRKKRTARGIADSAFDYGRPITWDAEYDNEEPADPMCYVALDGVVERR